ncbi:hypothetical protein A2706_02270 [Candidatus Peribacteria bacterium RIFCSPHIGHO2_01_FULL_51_35]|nr:MAG: hypothetical protein A2706_02270 [Candidatus Peribacteria bacterium RIFCSPHIGHO2_01_FULL_51_35]
MKHFLVTLWHIPRTLLVGCITVYQHTLSPDHGPLRHLHPYGYCRHSPTCSKYAQQIIQEKGVVVGSALAFWRLLRCNPWTKPDTKRAMEASHERK